MLVAGWVHKVACAAFERVLAEDLKVLPAEKLFCERWTRWAEKTLDEAPNKWLCFGKTG